MIGALHPLAGPAGAHPRPPGAQPRRLEGRRSHRDCYRDPAATVIPVNAAAAVTAAAAVNAAASVTAAAAAVTGCLR